MEKKYKNIPLPFLVCEHPLKCDNPDGKKITNFCNKIRCIYLGIKEDAYLTKPIVNDTINLYGS